MLRDDLVLCPLTMRKDLFRCSDAEFRSFIEAGARAGFSGFSLSALDLNLVAAEGLSRDDALALLRDHGFAVPMVEAATVWAEGQEENAIDEHIRPLIDLAVASGAGIVTAVSLQGRIPSVEVAARGFARMCALAAEHDLRVSLEFLPWGAIRTIGAAWEIVEQSGAENGGLLIDTWHWHRGGADLSALATIPPERIHVVQLCDAAAETGPDIGREALSGRLLPGEGAADLVGALRAIDRIGAEPIIAPEVFSHALVERGPSEMAQRVADASRAVIALARSA